MSSNRRVVNYPAVGAFRSGTNQYTSPTATPGLPLAGGICIALLVRMQKPSSAIIARIAQGAPGTTGWNFQPISSTQFRLTWGTGAGAQTVTGLCPWARNGGVALITGIHDGVNTGTAYAPGNAAVTAAGAISYNNTTLSVGQASSTPEEASGQFLAMGVFGGSFTTGAIDTWYAALKADAEAGRPLSPLATGASAWWWRASEAWRDYGLLQWPNSISGGPSLTLTRAGLVDMPSVPLYLP